MFKVKTLNQISPVYESILPADEYEVSAEAQNAEAILVRSADMHEMQLDPETLCVGRAGAGVNNIPIDRFAEEGVVVFNSPGANANAVKELVIAALLLASRDIAGGIEWAKTLKGEGDQVGKLVEKGKKAFVGPELAGKTLGVIGLGEIGARVANAGYALDMDVLGYDPYISVEHAWKLSRAVRPVKQLDELYEKSDYITVHVPLLDATRGMFNAEVFAKMKKGAALLNFSRGELVNNADLLQALESGQLRRYVTDFANDEILGAKNCVCLPHLGASTPESEDNCVRMVARQLDAYLKTGAIVNSVNFPACDPGPLTHPRVICLHKNVPNVLGSITSLIAAQGINIENMIDCSKGQHALSVLDLDSAPGDALLEILKALPNTYRTRLILPQ